jgi:two-component system, LytTR family, sensor kinase
MTHLHSKVKHIFTWLGIASISVVVKLAETGWSFKWGYIYETYTKYLLAACIFYFSFFIVFKRYYANKQYIRSSILLLVLLFLNGIVRHFIFSYLFVITKLFPIYAYNFWQSFTIGIWWWYMFSLFSFAYYTFKNSIITERKLRLKETQQFSIEKENFQLKSDNLQLQNEKLTAEYNYLKTQINPHFLYNTLNYFYAETMAKSPRAAKGIALLSRIMRYSLKPTDPDGKMLLADEIANLENYLNLQRIRFEDDLVLDCHLPETVPVLYRILPHLLLTLAENAFKHCEPDTLVHIRLTVTDDNIHYVVQNRVRNDALEKGTGVGLRNMTDRLNLWYGDKCKFSYSKDNGIFTATLIIYDTGSQIPEPTILETVNIQPAE